MIIALDYGDVNIGLAVTDEEDRFVFPRGSFKTTDILKHPESLQKNIDHFEMVTTIVVGLPKNLKGEKTPQTEKVLSFAELLKKTFPEKLITFYDERFSSTIVMRRHQALGGHQKDLRSKKDMLEAAQILEDYLRKQKNEQDN